MKKLSTPSRIIIGIASLSMIACYFLPAWFIYLMAPQYPEGLTMYIWLDKLTGQVDIINGLNHYIGMKQIKVEMFPEFTFLIYILGFFILAGLAVAISGKRSWLLALNILTVIGGAAAMYDFYQWGYDYGHNLDPTAAIQIPGFSYQPPLIGHKKLLNFDAYSYPDSGGWIIIAAASIFILVWLYEWRKSRKASKSVRIVQKSTTAAIAAALILGLSSCNHNPREINYGKDICEDCNMTIVDPKYGAQIITKKGRVYLFDDAHCVAGFLKEGTVNNNDIDRTLFIDFQNNKTFIDANSAFFIVSPQLKSPMNSNAAAFSNKADADKAASQYNGVLARWAGLLKTL
ncbi:MAG: nitrous oxide reductase accessory protein NosL [Ferruginibacter sp.]